MKNMEIVAMPAIELKLNKTSFGSEAYFSGTVEAVGSTGYKFFGTLDARCPLDRSGMGFSNTVRIGHGGVSGKYEHLDREITGGALKIAGEGKRVPNERVEFYVAVNEGISGQFKESPEVTCDLGVVADPVGVGIANKPDESVSARNAALMGSQTGPASSKSNFNNAESEGQDIRPTKTVRESVYVDDSENKKSI